MLEQKSKRVNKYKRIYEGNYSNIIFSNKAIGFGEEDEHVLKNKFVKPEAVYARCYLPEAVGILKADEFGHEITINGNMQKMITFNIPPEPQWDQIQIWISEDEYKGELLKLKPGTFEITIRVFKKVLKGSQKIESRLSGESEKEREIWDLKYLSKGKFLYEIP